MGTGLMIKFWTPIVISILLTPVLVYAGVVSSGAGHGNYLFARILFPFTMLSTIVSNSITLPAIGVAVVQFPAYGLILGIATKRRRLRGIATSLLLIHVLAVGICLLLIRADFS